MGRPTSATKLAQTKVVKTIRVRGGNKKFRALKLTSGNFVWKTQNMSKKVRITSVLYNAANNEFVRRNLLSKGTVVAIDKHPFEDQYKVN
jgi:small subunit ribosomal protein S8e